MRELNIGTKNFTKVVVEDEPADGGACHEYIVLPITVDPVDIHGTFFSRVSFQKGPVKENGVNGCHNEDLIAIVIDRLECFQAGDFACEENSSALCSLRITLMWLNERTAKRQDRGVEGTSKV